MKIKMKAYLTLTALLLAISSRSIAQDTFSIVAVDEETGEVGSAGASCVDLFQAGLPTDDFLGELFPCVGAINTQAYYIPANQNNAANQMQLGKRPSEIIDWLVANDVQGSPQFRQYGIVAIVNGTAESAGHTGTSTDNYKNHVTGSNYAIQGNILLGQEVLDSMEARYLRSSGDLACKLMSAMQGANMVGADSRCAANGSSSLFAFIKVAQPTDSKGSPSLLVGTRSPSGAGLEPIDVLQEKFDLVHDCESVNSTNDVKSSEYAVYPNPSSKLVTISSSYAGVFYAVVSDSMGASLYSEQVTGSTTIDVSGYSAGTYFVSCSRNNQRQVIKLIVQ